MQRNVGAAPGIGCGREVVGVGLTRHLEHGECDALGYFRAAGEPLGVGPALQHGFGKAVALVGLFLDVVKLVKHQQRLLQRLGRHGCDLRVVQQVDQRREVVAAQHGAQQLCGALAVDQRADFGAMGHSGQVAGLNLGSVVHAGRHAVRDQVQQRRLFAHGRVLEQFDQFSRLLRRQGQRRDAQRCALGHMVTVGFQHGGFSPGCF